MLLLFGTAVRAFIRELEASIASAGIMVVLITEKSSKQEEKYFFFFFPKPIYCIICVVIPLAVY